jgi:hypothetical protein
LPRDDNRIVILNYLLHGLSQMITRLCIRYGSHTWIVT